MTVGEFVRLVALEARKESRPVLAVDFEPTGNGLRVVFRYKGERP